MTDCPHCRENKLKEQMEKRTKCEVYSRVTGYLRPVAQWNDGKRAEYLDRKVFKTQSKAEAAIQIPVEQPIKIYEEKK